MLPDFSASIDRLTEFVPLILPTSCAPASSAAIATRPHQEARNLPWDGGPVSQAGALRYSLRHRKLADWMRAEPHPEVLKSDAPVAEKNEPQLLTTT